MSTEHPFEDIWAIDDLANGNAVRNISTTLTKWFYKLRATIITKESLSQATGSSGGQDDDVDSIGSGGGQDDDPEVKEVPPPPPPGNYADTPPMNMSGFSRATPKFPFIIGFHSLLQALIPSNPMLYLRRRVRL